VVNQIWSNYENETGLNLLIGAVLFTFQIYGDFSGYSDIAIGTARLFGFNLMRNFHYPYFSRDIAEFWRRWHISLTTWFRDYIYIPLGGSRCVKWKVMRNTLIIFLVSGFWHGANWTFIVWGAYHALLFFPLMLFGLNRKYTDEVALGKYLPSVKESLQMLLTFALAVIGWVIFRAETIGQAFDYLCGMCDSSLWNVSSVAGKKALLFSLILIVVEWLGRDKMYAIENIQATPILKYRPIRLTFYYVFALIILLFAGEQETFVYFQF
jgi:D-alanyl-lipoteichoic acid acyltransferase DltB (MBOAT superfamily)